MNYTNIIIFGGLLLIVGATNQVKGNQQEKQITLQKAIIEKAAHLLVHGIESLTDTTKNDDVANEIETQLAELDNRQDECSLIKKSELKALQNNVGLEICLNLTDAIDNVDNILNNVTSEVLGAIRDVVDLTSNLANCTLAEGSNLLQCVEDTLITLRAVLQKYIAQATELLQDIVSTILTTLENVIRCLGNGDSIVSKKLSTITNRKCQTGSKVINYVSNNK